MNSLTPWLSAWAMLFTGAAIIFAINHDTRWLSFTILAVGLWSIFAYEKKKEKKKE